MFLGDDLLPWLVLAFGGALAIGTGLALVRPPVPPPGRRAAGGDPAEPEPVERPPLARSLVMIAVGSIAALWAAATLLSRSG